MQRRTVVVVTSRHRKVRCTYAARTQCILLDTPMVKIIRHSIAADKLWIRKVRYRYVVASYATHTQQILISHCHFLSCDRATNTSSLFEIIVTSFRTLTNEAIVQRISYDSFRCCDVTLPWRTVRFGIRRTYASRFV